VWTSSGQNDTTYESHMVLKGSTSKLEEKGGFIPKMCIFYKPYLKIVIEAKMVIV
jgi:hypothetical protein